DIPSTPKQQFNHLLMNDRNRRNFRRQTGQASKPTISARPYPTILKNSWLKSRRIFHAGTSLDKFSFSRATSFKPVIRMRVQTWTEVSFRILGVRSKRFNFGLSSSAFLLLMTLGYAVYAADRTVLASVLALMAPALRLTNYEIGLLGSAQYIGVLCFVFLAGHLSDRYGRKSVLIIGLVVFTMFTWLIGFASSFLEAFVFRLISGFGEGIFWPVAMAAVASYFKERKGLALGIFYVGFDAGRVAGLSLGGLAYSLSGDWRSAFFAAPSLGLVVIFAMTALKGKFSAPDQAGGRIRMGSDALELIKRRNVILILTFALLATWA